MFQVYIKNFKRNNVIVTTEELMFSVPSANSFPVQKPTVKCSEDSADNFSFSMDMNSPYYDALLQLKTLIRVDYDGTIIFNGRVLSISSATVYHTKSVTCEGYFSFTNDTYYEGKQEKFRKKISVASYIDKILANHNENAPDKAIQKGNIDKKISDTFPTETEKHEPSSWTQTSSLLNGLTGNYGGHLRLRYSGNKVYLDWYKYYIHDAGDGHRPSVTIGKNILDFSSDDQVDIIFTRVIPIGDTNTDGKTIYIDGHKYKDKNGKEKTYSGKAIPVPFIQNLYSDADLTDEFHKASDYKNAETNFGVIYKTIQFGNAKTQEKLWNETKKWIKNCYFGLASSITVKAVDFHIQDSSIPKILLGECVDVTYLITRESGPVWETKKLVCKSASYDLFNPENNSYTFGIPSDMLENNKNNSSKKRAISETAEPKHSGSPRQSDGMDLTWRGVWMMIGSRDGDSRFEGTNAAMSFYNNGQLSGTITCYDPNEIVNDDGDIIGENLQRVNMFKDRWFEAKLVGKISSGQNSFHVGVSTERGVFACAINYVPHKVAHWYSQNKGYRYQAGAPGISSQDKLADIIENDPNTAWGGKTHAESFKALGKMSGRIALYDPGMVPEGSTIADHPELLFTSEIVGKFENSAGSHYKYTYIAISKEYGVAGYRVDSATARPLTVGHWYVRSKGLSYDNIGGFIAQDTPPALFATPDGDPSGTPTVIFEPAAPSYEEYDKTKTYNKGDFVIHNEKLYICKEHIVSPEEWTAAHWALYSNDPKGSTGKAFVGRDITGSGTPWRVKLNEPILYKDADGKDQVADGFVSASDFNVESIPSFKTKLGIFDIVIASKVEADKIHADLAELRKLLGNQIVASTAIWSSKGYFSKLIVGGVNEGSSSGVYANDVFYAQSGMSPINIMGHIYAAYRMTKVDGTLKLQGKSMNNQSGAWKDLASISLE